MRSVTDQQNFPDDFVRFRAEWPRAEFIEFIDPDEDPKETLLAGFTVMPDLDFIVFAKDPSGDPFVFMDNHVALLDRSTGEGSWHAKDFQEFAFTELATCIQMDGDPVSTYDSFFTAEQVEFLRSLPFEDEDEFDERIDEIAGWFLTQEDFEWVKN